ncbi:unnamed protein product [Nippostrongylus brasiliensis]|uniref:Tudor-knot domain-containing protein n=1 Tax=Nippostrongylus brasiliensis TaxID=27835 RepID=A0A0N4YWI1_NIPBR|nr:unnamed protein product [Nippostrongylus brasiliensis]
MPPKKIPAVTYELNDRILCKYGDLYYEGKIVNVSTEDKERIFTVHYQGWHKRHDAIIPESQSRNLFLPYTEQNLARAKYYGCLPPSLRDILEKDNDAVLNRRLLTKLPAIYPIDMMLCEISTEMGLSMLDNLTADLLPSNVVQSQRRIILKKPHDVIEQSVPFLKRHLHQCQNIQRFSSFGYDPHLVNVRQWVVRYAVGEDLKIDRFKRIMRS